MKKKKKNNKTVKVVINTCYGGFGLSPKAKEILAKKQGIDLYFYKSISKLERIPNEKINIEFVDKPFGRVPTIDLSNIFKYHQKFKKVSSSVEDQLNLISLKKDYGDEIEDYNKEDEFDPENYFLDVGYSYSTSRRRCDKNLIEVVEMLGKKANGQFSDLEIVEIPKNIKFEIEDYDGWESIRRKR